MGLAAVTDETRGGAMLNFSAGLYWNLFVRTVDEGGRRVQVAKQSKRGALSDAQGPECATVIKLVGVPNQNLRVPGHTRLLRDLLLEVQQPQRAGASFSGDYPATQQPHVHYK